jgi:hypothetical protein
MLLDAGFKIEYVGPENETSQWEKIMSRAVTAGNFHGRIFGGSRSAALNELSRIWYFFDLPTSRHASILEVNTERLFKELETRTEPYSKIWQLNLNG